MSSHSHSLPELLSPAGNFEKLKVAFRYGADAVFLGGKVFGLRKYADNFTNDELRAAIEYAHTRNKKVYVVLNGFAHDTDLNELNVHLDDLESLQPNGFIISDWAVASLASKRTSIPLHVSTQASVSNWRTVKAWQALGATRIILAREVSLAACKEIRAHCDVELEIFIHGAMCASYSGKCVISNYSAGRDSNRGGCIQSCRHQYSVGDQNTTAHIMNAKDLMGIRYVQDAIQSRISSLKIEGRMKSNLYVANATAVYRDAIDYLGSCDPENVDGRVLATLEARLSEVSNRTFSDGGFESRPGNHSIHRDFGGYQHSISLAASVKATDGHRILLETKCVMTLPIRLTRLTDKQEFEVVSMTDLLGAPLESAVAGSIVWAQMTGDVLVHDIFVTPDTVND